MRAVWVLGRPSPFVYGAAYRACPKAFANQLAYRWVSESKLEEGTDYGKTRSASVKVSARCSFCLRCRNSERALCLAAREQTLGLAAQAADLGALIFACKMNGTPTSTAHL